MTYLDSEQSSAECSARCSEQSADSDSAVYPDRETFNVAKLGAFQVQ